MGPERQTVPLLRDVASSKEAGPTPCERQKRYAQSEAGKAKRKAYRSTGAWKAKRNAYNQQRTQTRARWIKAYKLSRGCMDCGYKDHPEALDFDHRPGVQKQFEISAVCKNGNMDRLMAEIEKCDVVCANCHRVRTANRR